MLVQDLVDLTLNIYDADDNFVAEYLIYSATATPPYLFGSELYPLHFSTAATIKFDTSLYGDEILYGYDAYNNKAGTLDNLISAFDMTYRIQLSSYMTDCASGYCGTVTYYSKMKLTTVLGSSDSSTEGKNDKDEGSFRNSGMGLGPLVAVTFAPLLV